MSNGVEKRRVSGLRVVYSEGLYLGLLASETQQQATEGCLHFHPLVLNVLDQKYSTIHDIVISVQQGWLGGKQGYS